MNAAVVTRFAPSPTGAMHLGHAASAIRAHDLARGAGGRFVLRIEDIDTGRSRPEHIAAILADLRWLGLDWDEYTLQSQALPRHAAALARLRDEGLVYPCFCTRSAIGASLSAPHGSDGPLYPGTCRALSPASRDARMGEPHAWRLDVAAATAQTGALWWHDATAGRVLADPAGAGDVVLARKDIATSYHLAVTVDDAAAGITDVVRGVDLFAATHVHRLLQALLGLPVPAYHHHPLMLGADGQRLAKRHGSPSLKAMREAGEDGAKLAAKLRSSIGSEGLTH